MKKIYSVNDSKVVLGLLSGLKSRITSTKPVLTMLALLMVALFGVNERMLGGQAHVYVYSSPQNYGYVDVQTSNSAPSSYTLNKDHEEQGGWGSSGNKTFYLFYKAKSGYRFVNWYKTSENNYNNGTTVTNSSNLTSQGQSVTQSATGIGAQNSYYAAVFKGNSYTISFDGNGNTSGLMSDQSGFVYGTAKTLSTNTFGRAYTVIYDANGGSCGTSSATATYTFNGWKSSNGTSYADKASVSTFSPTPAHGATVTLTAQWTSASVTLPNATKNGAVLDGWYSGSTKIGDPGDAYTPTANITLTAKWISKYDFEITGDNYTINNEAWSKTGAFTFVHADEAHMTTTIQNPDVISYDRVSNTITAKKIGVSKITFTQNTSTTVNNGTIEYTITVDSVANTLAVSGTSFTKYVDQEVTSFRSNQNSNGEITTTSSNPNLAHYDISNNKIVIPNSDAQNLPFDNVIITISQAATAKYKAKKHTITLTVNKYANSLSCSWGSWSKDMNVDSETGVTFSATNTNYTQTPIVIEQTSGDDEGNVIATYSSTNNKITSIYNIGTATWSVSQAENYKYVAAETKTLTVNVVKGSTECNFYEDASQHEIGDWGEEWEAVTWSDNFVNEVSFQAAKNMGTAVGDLEVYIMINGNWQKYKSIAVGDLSGALGSYDFGSNYFTYSIASNVRGIKFKNTGSYSRAIKNLSLKRKASMTLSTAEISMPTNTLGGNHTTAKFTVDYSTCADQIKVVSNHPHITVSPASFASEGNGTKEITVTYACDDPESIDGVITVYTPYENKTINVHAATEKKSQEIKWSDLFAGETVSLPQTFTSNDAASATSKLPVTYTSGNSEIIEVAEDGLSFTVVGTGTTMLTATQAGDDLWKSASDTKTINASNKKIQRIKWNQQFTRSLSIGNEIPLTATVTVLNIATGVETESVERSAEIVYTCPTDNGVIEILNETNIRVLGYGNTTITASVAGNEEYEAAAPVTLLVRVREIQTGDCDMPLVWEQNNEIEFFQGNLDAIYGSAIAINHANGIPDKLSFDVRGAAWKLAIEFYKGGIMVQQSTDNQLSWNDLIATAVSPGKGETVSSGEIQLNPNATHIRFIRPSGGQGYHYVGNIHITRLPYLRTENTTIDLGKISVGEMREFTIPVTYCSVKGNMSVTKQYSDNGLTIEETIEAECGDMSSHDLQASILPSVVGPWTNTVTVRDPLSNMTLDVTINASIQKGDQVITWNPTLEILATEAPALNAVASSGLAVSYEVTSGNNTVARIDNDHVIILQPGTFAITVNQSGNSNYNAASSVVKEFTVTAETLTLLEAPTASDLTYGQNLSESTLTGGSVEDSKHNPVAGTFSWQNASTQPNAGNAQEFAVVFTPSENPAWYNTLQTTATVNVAKVDATLSWTTAPMELAYNATGIVYTAESASDGAITYSIIAGGAYAHIDANTGALTIDVPGNTITVQAAQAASTNYNAPESITVDVTIAGAPVSEFTNAAGDGDWGNAANWTFVPTGENPDVIVSGALEIDEDVTVGSLTIESTGSIAVITGGTLTVKGMSEYRAEYGDIHVLNDGALALGNSADLQVRDFTLDAQLSDGATSAASGQVSNEEKMNVNRDVYFQLSFDPAGAVSYGWYDFTVPFAVNINGGITRIGSIDDREMVSGTDFLIMEDDEVNYAAGGKGWRTMSNSGVLVPGKLYTITFNYQATLPQNTFRFAWNKQGSITNGTSYDAEYIVSSDAARTGWNAIGNGMLCHGYVSSSYKLQAYNHTDNVYEIVYDPKTFAVGTAFFVQVLAAGDIDWTPAEATLSRPLYAPAGESKEVEEFRLSLRNEATGVANDVLFFSASEEATEAYAIGHDLLKKGTPIEAKKAQMWATKGGKTLCDVEATLTNNEANTSLSLFTPQAQTYVLSVDATPEDADLYLTYNGEVIWDLTASPYVLDLAKGTTEGYGLRIVARAPQIATGVDETNADSKSVRKVLINNTIYLITPEGKMYDIVGKSAKY